MILHAVVNILLYYGRMDTGQNILTREKDPAAVALGRRGGLSTAQRRTPEERRQSARRAALWRWGKDYLLPEEGPPPAKL